MNLQEKIEDIRRQPIHVRWRYTLACLGMSMFFVIGIWIVSVGQSLSTSIAETDTEKSFGDAKRAVLDGKNQLDILRNSLTQSTEIIQERAEQNGEGMPEKSIFPVEAQKDEKTEKQPLPSPDPNLKSGIGEMKSDQLMGR